MVRPAFLIGAVVFATLAGVSSGLPAEDRVEAQPEKLPELKDVRVEGVVVQVGAQGLLLRTDEGIDYIANVTGKRVHNKQEFPNMPLPSVAVTGEGVPKHVVTGVYVDFETDLDASRTPKHIQPSLRIFTPTEQTILSCYGRLPEGGVNKAPMPFPKVGEGKWRVLGRITRIRGNVMTVAVQDGTLRIPVANTPLVELEVADHRFALPGDRAVLQGVSPELPMVFVANLQVKRAKEPHMIPPQRQPGEAVAEVDLGNPEGDQGGDIVLPKPPEENNAAPADEPAPPPKPTGVQVLKIN